MKNSTLFFEQYLDPNINNYDFHWLATDYPILHNHDFWEFMTITDGSYIHELNGKKYTISKGETFLLRPTKDYHRIISFTSTKCQLLNFSIRDSKFKEMCSLISSDLYDFLINQPLIHFTFSGSNYNILIDYASSLRTAMTKHTNRDSISNLFFLYILENIAYQCYLEKNNYPDWLVEILNKINDPKNIDIFAKDIVANTPYSHSYIVRNFNKHIGITLIEYIDSIKMNNAVDFLLHSDMDMLTISSTLGFSSLSHFNHLFKRTYGVSPKQYRKNNSNKL